MAFEQQYHFGMALRCAEWCCDCVLYVGMSASDEYDPEANAYESQFAGIIEMLKKLELKINL